jgi:putative SOS response-associated peptidase YedK
MTWGFPPPPAARAPVVNVRNLASPFWRTALSKPERRCLVPATSFSEWAAEPDPTTGKKRKVWFEVTDQPLFAFAGIWRPVEDGPPRFAFLTCEPNELVGPIHPKAMPVILRADDQADWLSTDYAGACALAEPYPAGDMRVVD